MNHIKVIKQGLKKNKKRKQHISLTGEETELIHRIRQETGNLNKNNVTRTKAYLDFYMEHPEVHWAFLAHMVSRNGGWNMTDLKCELLIRLLSKKEGEMFFSFIERGNWLIFQDAYPQLLLYRESLKRGKPLFFLLPYLHISIFMETIWNHFWKNKNESVLTTALIVNEQNYIEERVIQHPRYKKEVFNKLEFIIQDLLSFNHILFPYVKNGSVNLAGQTVNQFESLHQRILLGKRLYAVLFNDTDVLKGAEKWAMSQPHTGSRKDFWPHIFNKIHEGLPGEEYQFQLKGCKLRPGGRRIYSPVLESSWENIKHPAAEPGDWFEDIIQVADYFKGAEDFLNGEIENEYCKTLERLELAVMAKKTVSTLD
ncbi:DUF2515 domain-containing protein [Bacillus marinisedimentorum]|uniref:DUF2515 domain-containing protein n=1 Tax=Bacillus marinisedimentorum TaxID=1821260 RepID=UPI000871F82D|nr:DUF2515 domain-containing protein [Bacillus marinisedimentorum]